MASDLLVLTTSYPRVPGDPSGHFVESEVQRALAEGKSVRVLAAGGKRAHPTSGELFENLGGASIFRSPGALPRLKEKPLRVFELPSVLVRASLALLAARESEWRIEFLLPFAPLAALVAPPNVHVTLVGHGSDVRLLERLPRAFSALFVRSVARDHARYRFVSAELRERFLALPGAESLREKTSVEPPSVSLPEIPSKHLCRDELGFGSAPLAVVVGRLIAAKRIDVALRALRLTEFEHICVLGDGPDRRRLELEFPEVRFLGEIPRDRALRFVRAADLLVAASRTEGAPTAIREARALGTPVVSTRAGDLEDLAKSDPELYVVA